MAFHCGLFSYVLSIVIFSLCFFFPSPPNHLLSLLPEQPLSLSPQPCIRSSSISLCSGCFALDGKPEVLSHTTSRMLSFQPFNAEQSGDQWIGEWQSRSSRHCEPLDRVSHPREVATISPTPLPPHERSTNHDQHHNNMTLCL